MRSLDADEHAPVEGTGWPGVVQIVDDGLPGVDRKRQRSRRFPLPRTTISPARQSRSSNARAATSPARNPRRTINVIIAKSRRPAVGARSQDPRRASTWASSTKRGNPSLLLATLGTAVTSDAPRSPSTCRKRSSDRPQRGRRSLCRLGRTPTAFGEHEAGHIASRQPAQIQTVRPRPTDQERADQVHIPSGGIGCQTPLADQKAAIPPQQNLHR